MAASTSNLVAKLLISHIPEDQDAPKSHTEKRIVGNCFKVQSKQIDVERTLTVLLCGRLHNPVLTCQKMITNKALGFAGPHGEAISVIPLVAKMSLPVQKFKLPFKAVHAGTQETDFEFIFIKSV